MQLWLNHAQDILKVKEKKELLSKKVYIEVYHFQKKNENGKIVKLFWDQHPNTFLIIEN